MSNPRLPYRFSDSGPALKPPAEGSILVHLVVNVENWVFDASMPRTIITPPHGKETIPDVPNFSWADYGMRAGLPRMLKALKSRSLPASTSINASAIAAYPEASEAMKEAGWEFIGHGMHQKSIQQAGAEEDVVKQSMALIKEFTGKAPRGWLSPGLRESYRSPEVLKQSGIEYVLDWVIDDVPNWLATESGDLMALPYNVELNDSIVYAIEKHATGQFLDRTVRTLKRFEREVQETGRPRVLALGLHPHLMGVPHRIDEFEAMLDALMASKHTTFMYPWQIAEWYSSQVPPSA